MIITEITRQVKNPDRYNIFIDSEFAFGINGVELLHHKLVVGMKIDQSLFDKLQNELEFAKVRDAAVGYLGYRQRSIKEMRNKLAAKEFSQANIDRVVDLLIKGGYLDDVQFAAAFIGQKSKMSNQGKRKIVAELLHKGVAKDDIVAAYNQVFDEEEKEGDLEAALRALGKKLRNRSIDDIKGDPKEVQRLMAFLARRGFSYDVVRAALKGKGL